MKRATAARRSFVRREVATVLVDRGCYLYRHGRREGIERCATVNSTCSFEHSDDAVDESEGQRDLWICSRGDHDPHAPSASELFLNGPSAIVT